ncbi:MAG TPA: phage tail protein [Bacteroidales bacterium]|nr:phage tail protein [Bacteroidales bacterium]HQI70576.1 phage tail protein [Bacteroidales bacterium]
MAFFEKYPLVGFHFKVTFLELGAAEIDSRFHEVSGLSAELTVEELAEGGENRFTYKLPVKAKFPNLVLKRALSPLPSVLVKWAEDAIYNLEFWPCTVLVSLLNDMHLPVKNWIFYSAYPVKIQASDLKAQDNSVMVETLELAYKYSKQINII